MDEEHITYLEQNGHVRGASKNGWWRSRCTCGYLSKFHHAPGPAERSGREHEAAKNAPAS